MQAHAMLAEHSVPPKNFRIILTGAPSSGKTTTLDALKARLKENIPNSGIYYDNDGHSYQFVEEVATKYILAQKKQGLDPLSNLIKFEQTVLAQQEEEEDAKQQAEFTILDRSMVDNLAITEMLEVGKKEHIDIAGAMAKSAKARHYDLVFILDRLPLKIEAHRLEKDESQAIKQDEFIRRTYADLKNECGYQVISVPVASVKERVDFIVKQIALFNTPQKTAALTAAITKIGFFSATKGNKPLAEKSLLELNQDLEAINTKIELQAASIKACPRGILSPQMGQNILDFYIREKAAIEEQIEVIKRNRMSHTTAVIGLYNN